MAKSSNALPAATTGMPKTLLEAFCYRPSLKKWLTPVGHIGLAFILKLNFRCWTGSRSLAHSSLSLRQRDRNLFSGPCNASPEHARKNQRKKEKYDMHACETQVKSPEGEEASEENMLVQRKE